MRWRRLRWSGHVERKEMDDWVSACRNLEVAGSRGKDDTWRQAKDDLESTFEWGYEGYGAKARDGNGPKEVDVWHHWENVLTRISEEITDVKRVAVVVIVVV